MKKKFKDTKFGQWVCDHAEDIAAVSTGVVAGAGLGLYFHHKMKESFNDGFWNGMEVGMCAMVEAVSSAENGKEVLLNATTPSGDKFLSEESLRAASMTTKTFANYSNTHDILRTRTANDGTLHLPIAKPVRRGL